MRAFIEVSLETDTCFSQGLSGRSGDVDTEVEHDARTGLPILRGRTLKGLLVEEVALLLAALEPAKEGILHEGSLQLFGEPGAARTGALWIGDGHLPEDVASAVEAGIRRDKRPWVPSQVRQALTTIRRQTRVDRDSGAPDEGSLRGTRLLRAGLVFRHPILFDVEPGVAGRAVLSGAALSVRRAGLHRNRGWGAVSVRVLDEVKDVTVAWVRGLVEVSTPVAAAPADINAPASPAVTADARIAVR